MKPILPAIAVLAAFAAPVFADPLPTLDVPHTTLTPKLDASPDDPAWANAAKIPSMASSLMLDGKTPPAVPPTTVQALWDADYLYVRFTAADDEIYTPFTDRDAFHYRGDVAEIFFDPVGDDRFFYEIQLSPRGGILDQYVAITADPRSDEYGRILPDVRSNNYWANLSWNCDGMKTATKILQTNGKDSGWIAEFALPAKTVLKRLGQNQFVPETVRANFLRYEWPKPAKNGPRETLIAQNWSAVVYGCPHQSPARMGYLKLQPGK